jgi:YD repeat-containing protein
MTDLAYSADGTVSQRIDTNPVSTGTTYTTTFGYDWAKRPASVASPSVFTGTGTTTYRLDGLLASRTTPNGETLTLAYDAARRPLTATLSAGNTISQTYDRVGNVTTEGRSFSGISGDPGSGTNTFSYDPLRRLTAETGLSASRSYQYDLDGNRTRKVEGGTTIDYTYDRTDQLITQTIAGVGTAFSYDIYGNLTQTGNSVSAVTSYTYSSASHLTAINAPGTPQDVAFTLDALGRYATRAVVVGGTDTYGYLGSSETVITIVGATTRVSALGADGSRVATKDGTTIG